MSEYGSGITMAKAFSYDKERIKKALAGQILAGETEDGFIYELATKEECDKYILSAFDNAVYHCREALASGRAMEAYLKSKGINIDIKEFLFFREAENKKDYESNEYIYENDTEEE